MWISIAQRNSTRPPLDALKSIMLLLRQPWVPYRHSVLVSRRGRIKPTYTVTRSLTHKPWRFNILSMNILPLARLVTSEMWMSHLRSFVILIPKILTTSVLCRFCPHKRSGGRTGGSFTKVMSINMHLAGFTFIWFSVAHWSKLSKSHWMVLCWLTEMFSTRVKSSTYLSAILLLSFIMAALFAKAKKMVRPSNVPCGTPPESLPQSDNISQYLTHCILSVKKSQIQGKSAGLAPMFSNLGMAWSVWKLIGQN